MSGRTSIFESVPIPLREEELRSFVLQFKADSSSQRLATRLDYIRAARKLTLNETYGSEILVWPDFRTSQGNLLFRSPHFKIVVICRDDQEFDFIGFDEVIDKVGLMLADERISPPQIESKLLSEALSFVCETRLSPKWNKIKDRLVRFPDFLGRKDIQTIQADLRARQDSEDHYKVTVATKAALLRWTKLTTLDDLDIDPKHRQMFEDGKITQIPQQHLGNQWLHVLPKMTKGKLRFVSRQIIQSEHIQNHEDMRIYWKKTYGYELPANFGSVYCNITFGTDSGMGPEIFCYPIECVRVSEAFTVHHRENQSMESEVKRAFVEDLQEALPVFCKRYHLEFSVPKSFVPKLFNARKDGDQSALEEIDEAGDRNPSHDTGYATATYQTTILSSMLPKEATEKYVPRFSSVNTKIKSVASHYVTTQNSSMTSSAKRKFEDIQAVFSQEIPSAKKALQSLDEPILTSTPVIPKKQEKTKKELDLSQVPIWAAQGVLNKKSNAVILRQWLFEKGLSSKGKTKKDLVNQVMEELGHASEY